MKTWVAYSESKQDAELSIKFTDLTNTQTRGLSHDKKSEPESLSEQEIATSESSQPTSHESSCASLLAAHAKCLNQNESSCASLLAARAKCLNQNESSWASLLCQVNLGKELQQ